MQNHLNIHIFKELFNSQKPLKINRRNQGKLRMNLIITGEMTRAL